MELKDEIKSGTDISIIIPAYNAGSTIERAVKSIVDSGLQNYEIIIVENGSNDNTDDAVSAIQRDYSVNLLYLHSEKGVSNARNSGVDNSKGKWILFMDADDYYLPDFSFNLQEDMKNTAIDLYVYGHKAGDEVRSVTDNTSFYSNNGDIKELKGNVEDCKILFLNNPTKYMQVWAKLFKSEIIKNNGIRFNPKLSVAEDSDFTLRYLKHCESVCLSEKTIYNYSISTADSAVRTFDGKKAEKYAFAMQSSASLIEDESENVKRAYIKYVLMHLNVVMVREVFAAKNDLTYKDELKRMKDIMQNSYFADSLKSIKFSECKGLRMVPLIFAKMHLYRISSLAYILRSKSNEKKENGK